MPLTHSGSHATSCDAVVALVGDGLIRIRSIRAAEKHSKQHLPASMYLFAYRSSMTRRPGQTIGACDWIELPFVFGVYDDAAAFAGPRHLWGELSEQTMDAWTTFARTGDSNTPLPPAWPEYEAERRSTMVLGVPSEVVDDPLADQRGAWDEAPDESFPYWPPFIY